MNEREQLKILVFTAIGEASMCWNSPPVDQVFDSANAQRIGEELVTAIAALTAQVQAEPMEDVFALLDSTATIAAAHDARVRNEAIEECAKVCEAQRQKILANPDDPSWTEHFQDAITVMVALKTMEGK